MKSFYVKTVLFIGILLSAVSLKAQQNEDLLNLLVKKGTISQQEADSIRADQALKAQAQERQGKSARDNHRQPGVADQRVDTNRIPGFPAVDCQQRF